MLSQRIYNLATWIWHKVLFHPIRMRTPIFRRVKNPQATIIFLHGIAATARTWQVTIRELTNDHTFDQVDMFAVDLLGHGKSLHADWLDYDYHDYTNALNNTIKKLHINTPIILVGHSMGSLISANYPANQDSDYEISHLILVSPPVILPEELAKLPDKVYNSTYASLHQIATDVPAAEVVGKIVQKFSSFRSRYLKTTSFKKSMENIILNPVNYKTFIKLHVPTLLLHGHFDPLVIGQNLRAVAKANPNFIKYQSVIAHHDITSTKRVKIKAELTKILKNLPHETA